MRRPGPPRPAAAGGGRDEPRWPRARPRASWCCARWSLLGPVVALLATGPGRALARRGGAWSSWSRCRLGVAGAARVARRRRACCSSCWSGGRSRSDDGLHPAVLVAAAAAGRPTSPRVLARPTARPDAGRRRRRVRLWVRRGAAVLLLARPLVWAPSPVLVARASPSRPASGSLGRAPPAWSRVGARPPSPSRPTRRRTVSVDPEEYVELVLRCVEAVPRGRVTTYGAIAEVVGEVVGGGGPRQVGSIMASHGGPVPWWRVVRADGSLPPSHQDEARQAYLEEGTPLRPSGNVDIRRALLAPSVRGRDQVPVATVGGHGPQWCPVRDGPETESAHIDPGRGAWSRSTAGRRPSTASTSRSRRGTVMGLLGPNGAGQDHGRAGARHPAEARQRPRRGRRARRRRATPRSCARRIGSRASTPRSTSTSPAARTSRWSAGSTTSAPSAAGRGPRELLEQFDLDRRRRPAGQELLRRHAPPARPGRRAGRRSRRCCSSTSRPPASTRAAGSACGT